MLKKEFIHANMNIWEMFNETLLPDKKQFYCSLIIEDIADVDCKDAKRLWKGFKLKIKVSIIICTF